MLTIRATSENQQIDQPLQTGEFNIYRYVVAAGAFKAALLKVLNIGQLKTLSDADMLTPINEINKKPSTIRVFNSNSTNVYEPRHDSEILSSCRYV